MKVNINGEVEIKIRLIEIKKKRVLIEFDNDKRVSLTKEDSLYITAPFNWIYK